MRDDLVVTGKAMRAAILMETGLPTSVGFGATKTLAKLANHVAKTADRKPGSYPQSLSQVCDFSHLHAHELDAIFAATEVNNVWGVGKRITEKLKAGGIHTVLDLARADASTLRSQFSVVLEKTLLELRGTSCMEVDDAPAPRQQILVSRSFGTPITHVDGIIEAVSEFTSRTAERLRAQGSVASALGVFFMTSPFRQNDRQHSVNVTTPLVRRAFQRAVCGRSSRRQVRRGAPGHDRHLRAQLPVLRLPADPHLPQRSVREPLGRCASRRSSCRRPWRHVKTRRPRAAHESGRPACPACRVALR